MVNQDSHTTQKKITLMHIVPSLAIGGMENALVQLVNRLASDKYNILICCLENYERAHSFIDVVKSGRASLINLNKKDGLDIGIIFRLSRVMQKNKVDIIHARNWSSILYGCFASQLLFRKTRFIADIRGMHSPEEYRTFARLSPFITRFVAVTNGIKQAMEKEGKISPEKISVIHNGIDIKRFSESLYDMELRKKTGIAEKNIVIGTVGRLAPVKNYPVLLKACAMISRTQSDFKLIFVGDGPEHEKLQKLAQELGIADKVIFTGYQKDVLKFYKLMTLFVLPSLKEGSSNTILEAMASGVTVIASDAGGNKEIITDKKTGYLFQPADAAQLAEIITTLLSNSSLREEVVNNASRKLADEFSIDTTVEKYEQMYSVIFN